MKGIFSGSATFYTVLATLLCGSVNPAHASNVSYEISGLGDLAFGATESEFEDLARGVSARGLGGVFINFPTVSLSFFHGKGGKRLSGDTTEVDKIAPALVFTESVRFQLDEGVDMGLRFNQAFIASFMSNNLEEGFDSLFSGVTKDPNLENPAFSSGNFTFDGLVFITGYFTQTVFYSVGIGGKGWINNGDVVQGALIVDQSFGAAAPIRGSGFFIRPELKLRNHFYWNGLNPGETGSDNSTNQDWQASLDIIMDLSVALSYRHNFVDTLNFEVLAKGKAVYAEQPFKFGGTGGSSRAVVYPSADYIGYGWQWGASTYLSISLDDAIMEKFAPLSELSFFISYDFLTASSLPFPFFDNRWFKHSLSLSVKTRLY